MSTRASSSQTSHCENCCYGSSDVASASLKHRTVRKSPLVSLKMTRQDRSSAMCRLATADADEAFY